jgi:2',3'-cyclic-nucleotide 2'-phosphodiesterase (5'-nucleotidase family)/DNA-binding beta-propeller fold protein YncE
MSTTLVSTTLFTFDHLAAPGGLARNAEVAAYDAATGLIFVAAPAGVDVLTREGVLVGTIATAALGSTNSVAAKDGVVAIAIEAVPKTDPGKVLVLDVAFDGTTFTATQRFVATVGALPDMLTFTPDGSKILTANEGEPNSYNRADSIDPEGSVSIIDVATGAVTTATFTAFNGQKDALVAAGVRIFGPNATVAQDLEPEYIAVSADGTTAYVTLQENNAIAVLDIATATFTRIMPLGYKDHALAGNAISVNDQDDVFAPRNFPVLGMYQPDAILAVTIGGAEYLITANEGDARDYTGFSEEVRVGANAYRLDPTVFPNATVLKQNANLGRLTVTNATGNTDGDGDFDAIYAFGARSFSVWTTDGALVFDSGNILDEIIATRFPTLYDENRDDNKGTEPESLAFATIGNNDYLFVGLERANSVLAFRVEGPTSFTFAGVYATPGDIAPEVITIIPETATTAATLVVPNEVSFTTSAYAIEEVFTLQILHASDLEAGLAAPSRMGNFAAIVDRLEDAYANTLTLIVGDAWIPGPFYAAEADPSIEAALETFYTQLLGVPVNLPSGPQISGRVSLAFMNAIGTDVASWGNHEFDLGTNPINAIITPAGQYPGALFPYISANLDFSGDTAAIGGNLAARVTADGQEASSIKGRIAGTTVVSFGEEKVGLVGATTQILRSISSPGAVKVLGDDPSAPPRDDMALLAAQLQPKIDALIAQGINKIVLMSHLQQFALEQALIPLLSGVDIVISAGSHSLFADADDSLRPGDVAVATYPTILFDRDGNPVLQVNSTAEYAYVNRLAVQFDARGNIILDSLDPAINGVYRTDDAGVAAVWGGDVAAAFAPGTKGALVDALADAVQAVISAQDGNTFGWTDVFLDGKRIEVRREETNLGNASADANLWYAKKADPTVLVSIKNGGGIRDSIGTIGTGPIPEELPPAANPGAGKEEGEVSQLDITNALRFNNTLTLLTVTATELLAILEHGVSTLGASNTPGQFPQIGGMNFSFDRSRPPGDRILTATIVDEDGTILDVIARDGEVVGDPAREIRLVTLNFLANGGDGYPFPAFGSDRVDLLQPGVRTGAAAFSDDGTEQDAFAEYFAAVHGTPETAFRQLDTTPAFDLRIQQLEFRADTVEPVVAFELWRDSQADAFERARWQDKATNLDYTNARVAGEQLSSAPDDSTGAALARFLAGDGDVSVRQVDFAARSIGNAQNPAMTIDWQSRDATVTLNTAWSSIRTIDLTEFTGDALTVQNFLMVAFAFGPRGDGKPDPARTITLQGTKRVDGTTGDGNDVIVVEVDSNNAGGSNLIRLSTGGGDDVVTLMRSAFDWSATFAKTPYNDAWTQSEVELGAGNDILHALPGKKDTAVYRGDVSGYSFERMTDGAVKVTDIFLDDGDEGTDLLYGVELIRAAGQVFKIEALIA